MLIDIISVNKLAAGAYRCTLEVFGSKRSDFRALIYTYARFGEADAWACDLVVRASTGEFYARDFERRSDGYWRDSDGNVCESLAGLLPAEIRALELEQTIDLHTVQVTA